MRVQHLHIRLHPFCREYLCHGHLFNLHNVFFRKCPCARSALDALLSSALNFNAYTASRAVTSWLIYWQKQYILYRSSHFHHHELMNILKGTQKYWIKHSTVNVSSACEYTTRWDLMLDS